MGARSSFQREQVRVGAQNGSAGISLGFLDAMN